MKLLDLLHRWTGGLIGLVLLVLGLSGTVLIHRDAWVMLPHADDARGLTHQLHLLSPKRILIGRPTDLEYSNKLPRGMPHRHAH